MRWPGSQRQDEIDRYVRISDGASVIWKTGAPRGKWLWHATVDGLVSICPARAILSDEDPLPFVQDRSRDIMTCDLCADRVRRIKPSP
jgi:hypothetical protein